MPGSNRGTGTPCSICIEAGYARFFSGELSNPDTLILAAELNGSVVGYAYARLEPRDWDALLDLHRGGLRALLQRGAVEPRHADPGSRAERQRRRLRLCPARTAGLERPARC